MKKITLIILIIFLYCFSDNVNANYPDVYIEKMDDIPDFTQLNKQLPLNGKTFCAPVSVSNSIMWLSANGYENLTNGKNQLDVIKELAIAMQADEKGASPENLMKGLRKFIESKGYQIEMMVYQGRKNELMKRPDMNFVKDSLIYDGGVWLNIGWYNYKNENGNAIYERNGAHWVTVVGYGFDGVNRNSDYLIIHDPSSRTGFKFNNDFVKLILLENGMLTSYKGKKYKGLPTEAKGFYKVGGDMTVNKEKGDTAIIDGMVVLKMKKPL